MARNNPFIAQKRPKKARQPVAQVDQTPIDRVPYVQKRMSFSEALKLPKDLYTVFTSDGRFRVGEVKAANAEDSIVQARTKFPFNSWPVTQNIFLEAIRQNEVHQRPRDQRHPSDQGRVQRIRTQGAGPSALPARSSDRY